LLLLSTSITSIAYATNSSESEFSKTNNILFFNIAGFGGFEEVKINFEIFNREGVFDIFNKIIPTKRIIPLITLSFTSLSRDASYKSFTVALSGRIYEKGYKGWFGQLGLELGKVDVSSDFGSDSSLRFGITAALGYRNLVKYKIGKLKNINFVVDGGLGIGLFKGEVTIGGISYDRLSGVIPMALVGIGFNF